MSYIYCFDCKNEVNRNFCHLIMGQYVCEACFHEKYAYCDDCLRPFNRKDLISNYENALFCAECIIKNYDDDCPNDPPVSVADRNLILCLCGLEHS